MISFFMDYVILYDFSWGVVTVLKPHIANQLAYIFKEHSSVVL